MFKSLRNFKSLKLLFFKNIYNISVYSFLIYIILVLVKLIKNLDKNRKHILINLV